MDFNTEHICYLPSQNLWQTSQITQRQYTHNLLLHFLGPSVTKCPDDADNYDFRLELEREDPFGSSIREEAVKIDGISVFPLKGKSSLSRIPSSLRV
jgi:hypothetical protein